MMRRDRVRALAIALTAAALGAGVAHARDEKVSTAERLDILRRAQVWIAPAVPVEQATPGRNPADAAGLAEDAIVPCRFVPEGVGGSTPKFDCRLDTGEVVKVKYGADNAEVYTEVAATRLLSTLGFPADRMYVVAAVRCFGCPVDPFGALKCLYTAPASRCFPHVDYTRSREFPHAAIERPLEGRRIETAKRRGWGWNELAVIDHAAGGASRAEVDALRLMGVFLADWDNKPRNQRLLCLGEPDDSRECRYPAAMVQDVGGTFGPSKLNLAAWRATPIWSDPRQCLVSMRRLPYGGSSFPDVRISEDGRRFLSGLLRKLSPLQVRALFAGARVDAYPRNSPAARNIDNWVRAFLDKVHAISDREPCPE